MHLGLKLKTYHQSAKHRCKTLAQDAKKGGRGRMAALCLVKIILHFTKSTLSYKVV